MRSLPGLLIVTLPFLYAQDLPPKMPIAAKPAFEVSTIKPASPDRGFSTPQMKAMMQGLFADRLHLAFHREKKEMTAYVITEAKSGVKLEKNNSDPNGLMSFSGGGQQGMTVRNMTISEFAFTMQAGFLDRPVVDQTGFGNQRYNFVLKWTPDSGTAGADTPNSADAPPDIFAAFQEQLGLKLQSTKAPVDVMVIDRIEKPDEN